MNARSINGPLRIFRQDTLVNGKQTQVDCVELLGQKYVLHRGAISTLSLEDEWFEDLADPPQVTEILNNCGGFKPDLFTFVQRLPDTDPRFSCHKEWEEIAALPVKSYDYWWNKQIKGTTRNMVRKSQKAGIRVEETSYDELFVRGMVDIFNETPVRQGRRFWHYGKEFELVKEQFARFLFREKLIGAYYQNELVGFVILANAGRYYDLGQFISKISHRDRAVNNALMAKAVELCARDGLPYLTYGYWSESSLSSFKKHSGFEKFCLPRYFVPLTVKGRIALKTGAHRGLKAMMPEMILSPMKALRSWWLRRSLSYQ